MAKEPRLSAFSFIKNKESIQQKFDAIEYAIYSKKINESKLKTSSIGRLFDAVSSLLELTDYNKYEGYAAILLENEATSFYEKDHNYTKTYTSEILNGEKLCELILKDYNGKKSKGEIALKFHLTLVKWIEKIANKNQVKKIALSGGVFQNRLLVMLIYEKLDAYELFFHNKMSPNDENIAYGQLMYESFYNFL